MALAHPLEQLPSRVATSPFAVPSPKPRPSLSDAEQGSPDTATGIADPCRIEIELAGVCTLAWPLSRQAWPLSCGEPVISCLNVSSRSAHRLKHG